MMHDDEHKSPTWSNYPSTGKSTFLVHWIPYTQYALNHYKLFSKFTGLHIIIHSKWIYICFILHWI